MLSFVFSHCCTHVVFVLGLLNACGYSFAGIVGPFINSCGFMWMYLWLQFWVFWDIIGCICGCLCGAIWVHLVHLGSSWVAFSLDLVVNMFVYSAK